MANLLSLATDMAQSQFGVVHREFDNADDFRDDLLARIWEADFLPDEQQVVMKFLRRAVQTIQKRVSRREQRARVTDDLDSLACGAEKPSVADRIAQDDLFANAVQTPFDAEILAAELGLHPQYANFAELSSSQRLFSKSQSYKKRDNLHARIRSLEQAVV